MHDYFMLFFISVTLFIMLPFSVFKSGDIKLPSRIQEAMQMQVEAERKKRAAILESEGTHVMLFYS